MPIFLMVQTMPTCSTSCESLIDNYGCPMQRDDVILFWSLKFDRVNSNHIPKLSCLGESYNYDLCPKVLFLFHGNRWVPSCGLLSHNAIQRRAAGWKPVLNISSTSSRMLARKSSVVLFGFQPIAFELLAKPLEFDPRKSNPYGKVMKAHNIIKCNKRLAWKYLFISSFVKVVGSSLELFPTATIARPNSLLTS